MLEKKNIFSSKPNQIAQAALETSKIIFGDLDHVEVLAIGDSELTQNIGNYLKKNCNNFEHFLHAERKYFNDKKNEIYNTENLTDILKLYDIILVGFKSNFKLVNNSIAKKIMDKRKHKPIFFIDCGIPGNIESEILKISNCFLNDLNDLEQFYSKIFDLSLEETYEVDSEFLDEKLNVFLSNFIRKIDLNPNQVSIFEKYLRDYFEKESSEKEKSSILKFLNFFKN